MVKTVLLKQLDATVPSGKRSDFINLALEEALIQFSREKAVKSMDTFAERHKITLKDGELIKLKNYGRR